MTTDHPDTDLVAHLRDGAAVSLSSYAASLFRRAADALDSCHTAIAERDARIADLEAPLRSLRGFGAEGVATDEHSYWFAEHLCDGERWVLEPEGT